MPLRRILCFILLAFSLNGASQGLAWAEPRTNCAKFYVSWLVSDRHFDNTGMREDNIVEYGFYSFGVYGERKWGQRIITSFNIPFNKVYTELTPNMRNSSTTLFGDIDIGASYQIVKDSLFVLTGSVMFGIPVRKHEFTAIMTGDNEFNQLIKLEALKSIPVGTSSFVVSVYTGYNHRSLGYSEEIHYGASIFTIPAQKDLRFSISLDGIKYFGSPQNANYINPVSLFSNFKEYLRITPEVRYFFNKHWGISLSTSFHLSGKNYVSGPMYSVGVMRK